MVLFGTVSLSVQVMASYTSYNTVLLLSSFAATSCPVPEDECQGHTKWDYKCAVKTFFVTLLQVSLQVQHESNSDQHSDYWPFISLTFLMWCCPMVFTTLLYNGVYCTAVQWCLVYCCTMVFSVLLYNGV